MKPAITRIITPAPTLLMYWGADVYHFDYEQKDYNELLKLANGKPIALTETGELPKPEILSVHPTVGMVYRMDKLAFDI